MGTQATGPSVVVVVLVQTAQAELEPLMNVNENKILITDQIRWHCRMANCKSINFFQNFTVYFSPKTMQLTMLGKFFYSWQFEFEISPLVTGAFWDPILLNLTTP